MAAVDAVSIRVEPGEFYSLLGPSGCGKTTTLRLVAGFERPDAGTVSIQGADVTTDPPNRRNVNTVFQHYALFPHLTVAENVGYGLKHERVDRSTRQGRVDGALATVRLTELRDRRPRQLSGGQQQRVALARALVKEPAALLLDEPLAALDLKLRRAMQSELKALQQRVGITFLYVTHDQEEALTLSDRVAVMNDGRILQEGTPEEIYERPANRFVADFIGQTNFFEARVTASDATAAVVDADGLMVRCAPAEWAGVGDRVYVSIRPEAMMPANGHAGSVNRVEGTMLRRTYLGDLVRYEVLLRGGNEVTVQRQNEADDPAAQWAVGDRIELAWETGSARLLPVDDGALANEDDARLLDEPARL